MIEEIVKKIEQLPPVPNVVHELQDMYYMDSYSAVDIENVIKKDPDLVANILKIDNYPLYEFTREIVDIRQAIVMFGLEQIIEFALASFTDNLVDFNLDLYGIGEKEFLQMAQHKAKVATSLMGRKKERFILLNTAFLADVSKVILSNYAKDNNITFEIEKDIALNELDEIEKEAFGIDTLEVSALMFDKWNFEPSMIELLKNFKNRDNQLQEALWVTRQVVALDGSVHKDRAEGSLLASRLS